MDLDQFLVSLVRVSFFLWLYIFFRSLQPLTPSGTPLGAIIACGLERNSGVYIYLHVYTFYICTHTTCQRTQFCIRRHIRSHLYTYNRTFFPIIFMLAHLGCVSPELEHVLYGYSDVVSKVFFTFILESTNEDYVDFEKELALAQSRERSRKAFLHYVLHEIRVPLSSLVLGVDSLKDITATQVLVPSEQISEYLDVMGGSAEQMSGLLNDVLSLEKINEGKLTLDSKSFFMQRTVIETIFILQPSIDAKNLNLTYECPDYLPAVMGDTGRFKQVIANFLNNAVKFTPENGSIFITLQILKEREIEQTDLKRSSRASTPRGHQIRNYTVTGLNNMVHEQDGLHGIQVVTVSGDEENRNNADGDGDNDNSITATNDVDSVWNGNQTSLRLDRIMLGEKGDERQEQTCKWTGAPEGMVFTPIITSTSLHKIRNKKETMSQSHAYRSLFVDDANTSGPRDKNTEEKSKSPSTELVSNIRQDILRSQSLIPDAPLVNDVKVFDGMNTTGRSGLSNLLQFQSYGQGKVNDKTVAATAAALGTSHDKVGASSVGKPKKKKCSEEKQSVMVSKIFDSTQSVDNGTKELKLKDKIAKKAAKKVAKKMKKKAVQRLEKKKQLPKQTVKAAEREKERSKEQLSNDASSPRDKTLAPTSSTIITTTTDSTSRKNGDRGSGEPLTRSMSFPQESRVLGVSHSHRMHISASTRAAVCANAAHTAEKEEELDNSVSSAGEEKQACNVTKSPPISISKHDIFKHVYSFDHIDSPMSTTTSLTSDYSMGGLPLQDSYTLLLSVKDTGVGISKDNQKKLFQPFSQINPEELQGGGGSGLGLSICKKIIKLYDGGIGVHSEEGEGAEFYFWVRLERSKEDGAFADMSLSPEFVSAASDHGLESSPFDSRASSPANKRLHSRYRGSNSNSSSNASGISRSAHRSPIKHTSVWAQKKMASQRGRPSSNTSSPAVTPNMLPRPVNSRARSPHYQHQHAQSSRTHSRFRFPNHSSTSQGQSQGGQGKSAQSSARSEGRRLQGLNKTRGSVLSSASLSPPTGTGTGMHDRLSRERLERLSMGSSRTTPPSPYVRHGQDQPWLATSGEKDDADGLDTSNSNNNSSSTNGRSATSSNNENKNDNDNDCSGGDTANGDTDAVDIRFQKAAVERRLSDRSATNNNDMAGGTALPLPDRTVKAMMARAKSPSRRSTSLGVSTNSVRSRRARSPRPRRSGGKRVNKKKTDGTSGDLNVLVVDDVKMNRRMMVRHLQLNGLRACQASNGKECLELIKGRMEEKAREEWRRNCTARQKSVSNSNVDSCNNGASEKKKNNSNSNHNDSDNTSGREDCDKDNIIAGSENGMNSDTGDSGKGKHENTVKETCADTMHASNAGNDNDDGNESGSDVIVLDTIDLHIVLMDQHMPGMGGPAVIAKLVHLFNGEGKEADRAYIQVCGDADLTADKTVAGSARGTASADRTRVLVKLKTPIPIIGVSGNGDSEDSQRAFAEAGAVTVMVKPVKCGQIMAVYNGLRDGKA